jgi:hypothetical protein
MSRRVGFAILSYNEPTQLLRLTKTLNLIFDRPPIVCHHNFSQCFLNEAQFSPNVQFVHPHIVTQWGHITTPLAALRAFRILRQLERPEWFVLLSGSDYPIRKAVEVLADFFDARFDAYLDNREIPYNPDPFCQSAQSGREVASNWINIAHKRYWRCQEMPFSDTSSLRGERLSTRHNRMQSISQWCQHNRPLKIYGGSFWFEANLRTVDRLLDDPYMRTLIRYYRYRIIPEESLFHTALRRHPDLNICGDHKRYEDWMYGGPHPKWLDESDLPKMLSSGAHFARKFRPDGIVQRLLDNSVLGLY